MINTFAGSAAEHLSGPAVWLTSLLSLSWEDPSLSLSSSFPSLSLEGLSPALSPASPPESLSSGKTACFFLSPVFPVEFFFKS